MWSTLTLLALPFLVQAQNETATSANLTKWDWTSPTQKMHGVALGNWITLERWMNLDWWEATAGTSEDINSEWEWTASFGNDTERAQTILQQHWEDWVTDADIATIAQSGFNHLRIPIGYWALIPAIPDTPYLYQAGQMDQVTRVMAAAQANGLYVLLDLHGLPGSQNGEQQSGRVGLNGFYGDANQAYSDQVVDALIAYVEASPYRSIVSGIEVANEPVYYNDEQFQTLRDYHERCYQKLSTLADPIPMLFHPGSPNSNPLGSWQTFINGKDPSKLVFTIHPYIGRGASLDGVSATEQTLLDQLCSATESYEGYGVPVAITEWSLINPIVNDTAWDREWFSVQAKEYARSGGGIFWNWQINISASYDGEEVINFYQYSLRDLLERDLVPLPAANQTTQAYLASLNGTCGDRPTQTWASPVPSRQPSSTSTGRPSRKRVVLHEAL